MPDRHGNFKGITVPALPWLEEEEALDELERDKDAEALKGLASTGFAPEGVVKVLHGSDPLADWPYDDDPPDPL